MNHYQEPQLPNSQATQRTKTAVVFFAILKKNESQITNANEGDTIQFITESTCFYGEGGGQIGDTGTGQTDTASLTIIDTQKTDSGIFIHSATINSGNINIDQKIDLEIDSNRREALEKNHSATHLLQHALRQVLGTDVKQAGSLVEPNKLRFDFNCDQKPSTKDLQEIEVIVNTMIQEKLPQETIECGMEDALKQGAIAFFEDKYGDQVRVVKLGPKSIELCGGTHVANTGDIHYFKIISEGSVGKGTRRIVALTSTHAHKFFKEQSQTIQTLNNQFNTHTHELIPTLSKQFPKKIKLTTIETNTTLNDELSTFLKEDQILTYLSKTSNTPVDELSKRLQKLSDDAKKQSQKTQHLDKDTINQHTTTNTNGLSVTTYHIDTNFPGLRDEACRIAEQTQGAVCLSANTGEKVQVVVAISKSHTSSLNASTVLQSICQHIDGRGGGKDHLAMGAGSNQSGIPSLQEEFKAKLS